MSRLSLKKKRKQRSKALLEIIDKKAREISSGLFVFWHAGFLREPLGELVFHLGEESRESGELFFGKILEDKIMRGHAGAIDLSRAADTEADTGEVLSA